MKIITIIGARPQFVKAAVVSRAIELHNEVNENKIDELIIHTGQHYDKNMSDVFFDEMGIPHPHYNLGIGGKTHGAMTGEMLIEIEKVLLKEKPDFVLIYGDTNSTLAGALASVKLHIPIAHVEAGLRSYNRRMPEEINRILADEISTVLFCPTETAIKNLKAEGIVHDEKNQNVINVGDVMYDAAMYYRKKGRSAKEIQNLIFSLEKGFYLSTIHRAENTDDSNRLSSIIRALNEISSKKKVVLPLHPRTRKILEESNLDYSNIEIIDPVGYFDMIALLDNCNAVFTDSGGVQKEAYFFEKPCVTLRDETEWVELVEGGFNTLVGTDYQKIMNAENNLFSKNIDYSKRLYGDGLAGQKIVKILTNEK